MKALILVLHGVFWALFLVRGALAYSAGRSGDSATTPASVGVVLIHAVGMGVFFTALGPTLQDRSWLFTPQPELGAALLLGADALAAWTLFSFRSWRLRAQLDADHELMTTGPFGLVRHPIYAAVNLYVLGTFLALPGLWLGLGVLTTVISGDVRARYEERVLHEAFGERYAAYAERVSRLVPWVY